MKKEFLGSQFKVTGGVGCESCYGVGGKYYKLTIMKDLSAGKLDPDSVGLFEPDEKVCTGCHNKENLTCK